MSEMLTPQTNSPVYSQFGGDEDLGELVVMYVDEMPERIEALITAQGSRDFESLARLTHQLKGASGSYGFSQISAAAVQFELAIKEKSADMDGHFERMIDLCRRAKAGVAE